MKNRILNGALVLLLATSGVLADEPAPANAPTGSAPASSPAPECKLIPVKMANPDDYYPSAERLKGHAGRPVVEFALMESPGKPVDMVVVESSSYPELDAAALRAMSHATFKTTCLGNRWKVGVKFSPH